MAKNTKLFSKILLQVFLSLIIFVLASCSSKAVRDKLNGGFENNIDGSDEPDGWTSNQLPHTVKYAQLNVDNSIAHNGDRSISISISKTHPSVNTVYNWVRRVDGLKPAVYELNGWIKTAEIKNPPYIEVQCWNNENKMLGRATTREIFRMTGTKDWQQVKILFKIPKGTTKILLIAGIESSQNYGGKVWFDDIGIRLINN